MLLTNKKLFPFKFITLITFNLIHKMCNKILLLLEVSSRITGSSYILEMIIVCRSA